MFRELKFTEIYEKIDKKDIECIEWLCRFSDNSYGYIARIVDSTEDEHILKLALYNTINNIDFTLASKIMRTYGSKYDSLSEIIINEKSDVSFWLTLVALHSTNIDYLKKIYDIGYISNKRNLANRNIDEIDRLILNENPSLRRTLANKTKTIDVIYKLLNDKSITVRETIKNRLKVDCELNNLLIIHETLKNLND